MPQHARYRAPAESGQKLISPRWGELGGLLRASEPWRRRRDVAILGQPLDEFASQTRREVLHAAAEYVAGYAGDFRIDVDLAACADRPLVVTGHQPELFHPGVWVKNFAAAKLARQNQGLALNVIIDGDACHGSSIRIPAGTRQAPRFGVVEFDRPAAESAWEERRIGDRGVWETFADRVRQKTAGLLSERMLDRWWPTVVQLGEATRRPGLAIAQARHLAEAALGQRTLELPQSRLCRTQAFRRFAYHILTNLPRFARAYNDALAEYRRAHGIRNHAQPAPDLAESGQWLEAPFWLWSPAATMRRPAFVRRDGSELVVSDRKSFERTLPLVGDGDALAAAENLARWEADGCKLRSRALVTTMFMRLAVADLFVHGIGGAKYDEATDGICQRFFGAAAPPFATVSGTLHLPIAQANEPQDLVRSLKQRLRDLEFHPERFLPTAASSFNGDSDDRGGSGVQQLIAHKLHWVHTPRTPSNARERHVAIRAANEALRLHVAGDWVETQARLDQAGERIRSARVLNSREYAFCLFPRQLLEYFLLDFSPPAL